jgi:hypothetical protein
VAKHVVIATRKQTLPQDRSGDIFRSRRYFGRAKTNSEKNFHGRNWECQRRERAGEFDEAKPSERTADQRRPDADPDRAPRFTVLGMAPDGALI